MDAMKVENQGKLSSGYLQWEQTVWDGELWREASKALSATAQCMPAKWEPRTIGMG